MEFQNTYEDGRRASAYDELEWGGTYLLVHRALPELLGEHVSGKRAVEFGCGTGRTARYLQELGFTTIGIDISEEMVSIARERDPVGDYRVIEDGDFSRLQEGGYDLVLAAFPFDNIPGRERKIRLLAGLRRLLAPEGRLVNIVCTPEIYLHEWVTFTTKDFPENQDAVCGDVVKIVTREYSDSRPVDDILWPHEDYLSVYRDAGLQVIDTDAPLASGEEGIDWISETKVAPWRIYLLGVG
jgi:ubiquinone/menaquinone biosynthesis C-methylase UbiE